MTEVIYYSLNDFNTFTFNSQYQLESYVLDNIRNLNSKLGIKDQPQSVYVSRELREDNHKGRRRKEPPSNANSDEAWEQLRTFKSTIVEKKTEGIEKTINDIRIALNKISKKNYDSIKTTIIESIENIYKTDESIESINKVATYIFEIASTNKFFSEIYAKLYKELVEKFEVFQTILSNFISRYIDGFKNIQYFDQTQDYDKFCENNKINDARKSTSVFIVSLVKIGVLDESLLLSTMNELLEIVVEYIDTISKTTQVDEITENIFLIVTESYSLVKNRGEWPTILECVKRISQMKTKEQVSLSSRSLFKYMDIIDFIDKINRANNVGR
jgi:hypothetical protein